LAEKLIPRGRNHDEHSQTDILTSGSNLTPAFPAFGQWPWEFVTRYSGATVPDFHGVPRHLTVLLFADERSNRPSFSKNIQVLNPNRKIAKKFFQLF